LNALPTLYSVRADYTSLFKRNDYDTTPVLDALSANSTVF
jgi:hypothetical protein